jgi:protein O-GlcNAc transferase
MPMSDPREVEAVLRHAIQQNPSQAHQWSILGSALLAQSRWEEAADAFLQSLALDPNDPTVWSCLGAAQWAIGHLNEAEVAYERSLAISRDNLIILRNYALLLTECQQPARALKLLEEVLNRDRGDVAAWLSAGNALQVLGDMPQAALAYRQALLLDPANQAARYTLALLQIHHGSLAEAELLVDQIVASEPQSPDAWGLVASLRQRQLRDRDAAAALRKVLVIQPNPAHYSNLLHTLQYDDDVSPSQLLVEHQAWSAQYAAQLSQISLPARARREDQRLRIGLVSSDFGRHPTGFLALRPLECLDKSNCSLVCYYDLLPEDEYTVRFRAAADAWHVTRGWSNERLAEQVRRDEIDVLIDLMGHTGLRLLVFARKPAPLQITWFGYVGTTGLATMDCLLADRYHVREGEDVHYVERVLRMPHGYACYGPPEGAPEVNALPAPAAGHVTFGCFNNAAKLSPRTLDAWAEVLRRVPGSRLLLKNRSLGQVEIRERIQV